MTKLILCHIRPISSRSSLSTVGTCPDLAACASLCLDCASALARLCTASALQWSAVGSSEATWLAPRKRDNGPMPVDMLAPSYPTYRVSGWHVKACVYKLKCMHWGPAYACQTVKFGSASHRSRVMMCKLPCAGLSDSNHCLITLHADCCSESLCCHCCAFQAFGCFDAESSKETYRLSPNKMLTWWTVTCCEQPICDIRASSFALEGRLPLPVAAAPSLAFRLALCKLFCDVP